MTVPYHRRRDPVGYTRGWEVAVAAIGGFVFVAGLAALLGLAVAAALFGGGWVWPHGMNSIGAVLGGLLIGRPGRGLAAMTAGRVPGPAAVYPCIAVAELLFLTALAWCGVLIVRRFRNDGMATRWEEAGSRDGSATRGQGDHPPGPVPLAARPFASDHRTAAIAVRCPQIHTRRSLPVGVPSVVQGERRTSMPLRQAAPGPLP